MTNNLTWKVKYFNCNVQRIEDYDILKSQYSKDFIKKLKKECATKKEFSKAVDREMMYRYWSRSEWELIIKLDENKHIWLYPWVGCITPEEACIDVTEDESFNWQGFIGTQYLHNNEAKIDVYTQLK